MLAVFVDWSAIIVELIKIKNIDYFTRDCQYMNRQDQKKFLPDNNGKEEVRGHQPIRIL
ncbi:UNKNOWN [Stylonychia lemnae]|uniref:Uncharacterized protein n=1 Tax=Stylonychia lemnae TaxID=5949 RepID=A0A078AL91_STYLE|nr:UNKNOWN [Stylonychia lemnae]|eukprot:CDW83130.1 UNKNOWN [Stylonychia lemnae]